MIQNFKLNNHLLLLKAFIYIILVFCFQGLLFLAYFNMLGPFSNLEPLNATWLGWYIEEYSIMLKNIHPCHHNMLENIFSNVDKIYLKYSFMFMKHCSLLMFTYSRNNIPFNNLTFM